MYLDLKFENIFEVQLNKKVKFKLKNYGGRIECETFWFGLFKSFEKKSY